MKKHEKRLAEICISAQVFLMTYYRDTTEEDRGEELEEFMVETIEVLERAVERARNAKGQTSFADREFELIHLSRVLYDLREVTLGEGNHVLFEEMTEYLKRLQKLFNRLKRKN